MPKTYRFSKLYTDLKTRLGSTSQTSRQLAAVGSVLIVLGALLIAAILLKQPQPEPEVASPPALQVQTIVYGQEDISEQAVGVIKNLNTLTLVAQSAGPVASINYREGSQVKAGQTILSQETAYQAGNAATVQRQIAGKSFTLADETLKNTVDVVAKTREQADLIHENAEELRELSDDAIDETKHLIGLMETQVDDLETMIATASSATTLRGSLISVQGSLNATRAQLRALEYESDDDNPPAQLADVAKDLVHKSTELQLKAAEINKDIAWLGYKAAKIAEAATRVAAPLAGTIEKIYVEPGQYVTPGTPVAVLRGEPRLCLQISVSGKVASRIQETDQLTIQLDGTTVQLPIAHVSSTAVNGQLYEVLAAVPEEYAAKLYEGQSANVVLPLYPLSQQGGNAYVPLDAIFVTNRDRFVFTFEDGVARRTPIETGEIIGNKIEVTGGLASGQKIIVDRRVIDQQPVTE